MPGALQHCIGPLPRDPIVAPKQAAVSLWLGEAYTAGLFVPRLGPHLDQKYADFAEGLKLLTPCEVHRGATSAVHGHKPPQVRQNILPVSVAYRPARVAALSLHVLQTWQQHLGSKGEPGVDGSFRDPLESLLQEAWLPLRFLSCLLRHWVLLYWQGLWVVLLVESFRKLRTTLPQTSLLCS